MIVSDKKKASISLITSIFCFLGVFVIFIFRANGIILQPFLWAEDGHIFLPRALDFGIKSIFIPYAGYLNLIPQGLTWLSIKLSMLLGKGIQIAPQCMQFFILCIMSFSLSYFCHEKFSWCFPQKWKRFIVCCFLALFANKNLEIWYSITNAQWWFGLIIFFEGLNMFCNKTAKTSLAVYFLLLAISFSSPLGILIPFILFYLGMTKYLKNRVISRQEIILFILFLVPPVIMFSIAKSSGQSFNSLEKLLVAPCQVIILMLGNLPSNLFQLLQYFPHTYFSITMFVLLGSGIWSLIFINFKHKKLLFWYCVGFIATCLFLGLLRDTGKFSLNFFELRFFEQVLNRYLFIPQIIFLFFFSLFVLEVVNRDILYCVCVCVCVCCRFPIQFNFDPSAYSYISKMYDPHGESFIKIPTSPSWWENSYFICKSNMKKLNEVYPEQIQYDLNSVNDILTTNPIPIEALKNNDKVSLFGWVIDTYKSNDPQTILIKTGENHYQAANLLPSEDVSATFGESKKYKKSRFKVSVPTIFLEENDWIYDLFIITSEGKAYYKITGKINVEYEDPFITAQEIINKYNINELNEVHPSQIQYDLNSVNDILTINPIPIEALKRKDRQTLYGWVIDTYESSDPTAILIKDGEDHYQVANLLSSNDVSTAFGESKKYKKSRFKVSVPTIFLEENDWMYDLFIITSEGKAYYKITGKINIEYE